MEENMTNGVMVDAEPRRWHELKTDPSLFDEVAAGRKTWEIRLDDRDYMVGDGLILRKTLHSGAQMRSGAALVYVGEPLRFVVTHVLTGYGLQDGWCGLSIRPYGVKGLDRG